MKLQKIGTLLLGIVIGAALTFSPQIYGAGAKLLGSKVDNTLDIKLNGKSIGQGAVINGTSYLPVRSAANALGLGVKVDSTTVDLTGKSSEEISAIAAAEQAEMDKQTEIERLTLLIDLSKKRVAVYESGVANNQSSADQLKESYDILSQRSGVSEEKKEQAKAKYDESVRAVNVVKDKLEAEKQNLADLEAQLAKLQSQ